MNNHKREEERERWLDFMRGGASISAYDWESMADYWLERFDSILSSEKERLVKEIEEKSFIASCYGIEVVRKEDAIKIINKGK